MRLIGSRTFSSRRQTDTLPPRVPPWPTVTNLSSFSSVSLQTSLYLLHAALLMSWAHFSGGGEGGDAAAAAAVSLGR